MMNQKRIGKVSKDILELLEKTRPVKEVNKILSNLISVEVECEACNATGLYCGHKEDTGLFVVCQACDGTGKILLDLNPFKGKKKKNGVKRVFKCNPGISIKKDDLEKLGGMSYKDWFSGKPFPEKSEMREHVCPLWWSQETFGENLDWKECKKLVGSVSFRSCKKFKNKEKCWKDFDNLKRK